jgi:MFS family permease
MAEATSTTAPTAVAPTPTAAANQSLGSIVKSPSYLKLLLLSISFLLLFIGFMAAQNFQTTMSSSDGGNVGANALAILYAVFMVSTFFSTTVVQKVGLKKSLIIASLSYVLFCAYNLYPKPWFAYLASALDGLCAAVLWTAQGTFVTKCVTEYSLTNPGSPSGLFNGTFFCLFQNSQFIGNLLVAILFQAKTDSTTVFVVLTLICASGTCVMLFLKEPILPETESSVAPAKFDWANFRMFKDRKFQLITFIILFSGIQCGFIFGSLPALVPDILLRFYVLATMGFSDMVSSLSLGTLSDRLGRMPIIIAGAIAGTMAFILVIAAGSSTPVQFVVAILLGISDAVVNTQPYAVLGLYFEENPTPAFANFRLLQSMGITISFLYFPYTSFGGQAAINLAFLAMSLVSIVYLHKFVKSIEKPSS